MNKDIYILAIETSCDDTSIAIVKNGKQILSNIVWNQNITHEKFGGIVPELGARRHLQVINYVLEEALNTADISLKDISAIAVNNQKGLIRSLVVGVSAAKALAFSLNIPLISVHHIEGHIYSNFLSHPELKFPHLCLTVSGGHNLIIAVNNHFNYQVIGNTLDDAAGEVFDKIARHLKLGFPGGPIIDKLSTNADFNAYKFTRPMLDHDSFDFSFSGLKTEVSRTFDKVGFSNNFSLEDFCASFQQAIIDTLIGKSIKALKKYNFNSLSVVGGVSANQKLRSDLLKYSKQYNFNVYFPELKLTTDNAAMIAAVGYQKYINADFSNLDLEVQTNQPL
jgi:N6-L-threonylcarbamoyladenine synthase